MKKLIYILTVVLMTSASAIADRPLEEAEVLRLLNQLCQHPMSGWISQGRIEGIHTTTVLESGETVETEESVVVNGERFRWNIQTVSQDQSSHEKGKKRDDYLRWNQQRTFIWDGFAYTLYFNPGNRAVVYETPSIPVKVSGPLKAGVIPWGLGTFRYEKLTSGKLSGQIVQTNEQTLIHLSIELDNEIRMEFTLDPDKSNAILSYTRSRAGSKTVQTYGNFEEHAGRWIPMNILIDTYYNDRLLSYDAWELTLIDDNAPAENSFKVSLRKGAMVEQHNPILESPVFFQHRKKQNIDPLLEKRFIAALKKDTKKQNCATVAVEKILSAFDISATDDELESLVDDESKMTSLYQVQQLIQKKSLTCTAIKTDLSGIKRYKGQQILLHFPMKKHFVILDKIEQDNIWLIDLDRQTFYYSMDRKLFEQAWAGIALIVTDTPMSMNANDRPVPDKVLQNIVGSADYACVPVQGGVIENCPEMSPMGCGGRYISWSEYSVCQPDSEGGDVCIGIEQPAGQYAPCVENAEHVGECNITGEFSAAFTVRMCSR